MIEIQTNILAVIAPYDLLGKEAATAVLTPAATMIKAPRATQAMQPGLKLLLEASDHSKAFLAETRSL